MRWLENFRHNARKEISHDVDLVNASIEQGKVASLELDMDKCPIVMPTILNFKFRSRCSFDKADVYVRGGLEHILFFNDEQKKIFHICLNFHIGISLKKERRIEHVCFYHALVSRLHILIYPNNYSIVEEYISLSIGLILPAIVHA